MRALTTVSRLPPEFSVARILAVTAGFTLIASFAGPFGTYEAMAFIKRLLFWIADSFVICFAALLAAYGLQKLFPNISAIELAPIVASIVAFPAALYINWLFPLFTNLPLPHPSLIYLAVEVFFSTTVILIFQLAGLRWIQLAGPETASTSAKQGDAPAPERDAAPQVLPRPAVYGRLPDKLQTAQILFVSMNDHYAKFGTDLGEHLELARFSDVLAELEGITGAQVHRSHWVSASAAERLEKNSRKHVILLKDGTRIPVSKTYLDNAKSLFASK